ncbi:MAG: hypothetical protein GX490_01810 [Bacilli bacterium]|nr:hypothetical protein [Bacilli bacterium]
MKELDLLETRLRTIIGKDYWVNVTGDIYKPYIKHITNISEIFTLTNHRIYEDYYSDRVSYYNKIKQDRAIILPMLGLDDNEKSGRSK